MAPAQQAINRLTLLMKICEGELGKTKRYRFEAALAGEEFPQGCGYLCCSAASRTNIGRSGSPAFTEIFRIKYLQIYDRGFKWAAV